MVDLKGIADFLKKGASGAADLAGKGAKLAAKGIGQAADELTYNNQIKQFKEKIAGRLSVAQMKKICNEYNLSIGAFNLSDSKLTRDDYLSAIIGGIDSSELIDLVARRTGASRDFINSAKLERKKIDDNYQKRKIERWKEEGQSAEQVVELVNPRLKELTDFLTSMDLPEKIFDERNVHDIIFSSLKNSGKFSDVEKEWRIDNQRPDMRVGDVIVEIKVPKVNKDFDSAYFQALRYQKIEGINNVILFVFTIDDSIAAKADEYNERYSGEMGLITVSRGGRLRIPKIKWRYPNIQVSYK